MYLGTEYKRIPLLKDMLDWNTESKPQIQMLQLQSIDYHARRDIDRLMLSSRVTVEEGYIMNSLSYKLSSRVFGCVVKSVRFPKNWKEAFKERWFPQWLLRKYPVKYEELTLDMIMPNLKSEDPEFQTFMRAFPKGESPYENNR